MKPGCEPCLGEVEAEMKCKVEKVDWLPGFYSLPPGIQIAGSKSYKDGKVRNTLCGFHGNAVEIRLLENGDM